MNTFSSIDKGEYHKLYDYVTAKKLRIKNRSKLFSFGSLISYILSMDNLTYLLLRAHKGGLG